MCRFQRGFQWNRWKEEKEVIVPGSRGPHLFKGEVGLQKSWVMEPWSNKSALEKKLQAQDISCDMPFQAPNL